MNKLSFIAFIGLFAFASTQTLAGSADRVVEPAGFAMDSFEGGFGSGGDDIPILELENFDEEAGITLYVDETFLLAIDYVTEVEIVFEIIQEEEEEEYTLGTLIDGSAGFIDVDYESSDEDGLGFDVIEDTENEVALEEEYTLGILIEDSTGFMTIDYESSDEDGLGFDIIEGTENELVFEAEFDGEDIENELIIVIPLPVTSTTEEEEEAVIDTPLIEEVIGDGLGLKNKNGEFVQVDGNEVEEDMEKIMEKGFLP